MPFFKKTMLKKYITKNNRFTINIILDTVLFPQLFFKKHPQWYLKNSSTSWTS